MADLVSAVARLRASGSVFAEDEAQLVFDEATSEIEREEFLRRREAGEPLEWILGWSEFCVVKVRIHQGVFLPRYRTEFLVEIAKTFLKPNSRILDLCCGSGAIATVLAAHDEAIEIYASDSDVLAVNCAGENLRDRGTIYQGDLFNALPLELAGDFNLIVINAPYVPFNKIEFMPSESRLHEPLSTLDGGADGLDFHRRIAAEAGRWLSENGVLLIEVSEEQAPTSAQIFSSAGFASQAIFSDEHEVALVMAAK